VTSAAHDIVSEIFSVLTTPAMDSVPATAIYRDLMDARRSTHMPCIAIELGDEDAPVRSLIVMKDRKLTVEVTVLASGSDPYGQADAAVVESFNRIMSAATPGGAILSGRALDIIEGPTRRQRDGLAEDLAAVTKTYTIEYRTQDRSLEAL
jgi:hypothetical protein